MCYTSMPHPKAAQGGAKPDCPVWWRNEDMGTLFDRNIKAHDRTIPPTMPRMANLVANTQSKYCLLTNTLNCSRDATYPSNIVL